MHQSHRSGGWSIIRREAVIIVPYVHGMLRERTARIRAVEFVRLPSDDQFAYWRLLVRVYEHGGDFLLIEQDMAPTDEQIVAIMECSEPWCVFGYLRGTFNMTALGMFRLRKEVYAQYPSLLRRDLPREPPIPFDQCDGIIYSRLSAIGLQPHRHYPDVEHDQSAKRVLHEYDIHGYIVDVVDTPLVNV